MFISSNLAVSFLLSGVLQYLWGMVNALQMIVMTVLFSVIRPVNAEVVLTTIMSYVNLDLIETYPMLDKLFTFKESEPFNQIFLQAGYESTTYLVELGLLIFIILGFGVFVLV